MKDGILVVNKPEGLSSAAVVGRLKRLLGVKKIGHTGTLDPFATGVLLIAVQKATRISRFFLDGSKRYRARVTLGIETDTYDCTGKVVSEADPAATAAIAFARIKAVVEDFSGPQQQVAPAFSALKHKGQPLYKLARQGREVIKPPRDIEIHSIFADNLHQDTTGWPVFDLDVHCSGGTYIRSLAHDIGARLGCGAHLSGLERTGSGQFGIDQATGLDSLLAMDKSDIDLKIVSMSQCLNFLPFILADNGMITQIRHGQRLSPEKIQAGLTGGQTHEGCIRVIDETDRLLAIIEPAKSGGTYNYCCVFIT